MISLLPLAAQIFSALNEVPESPLIKSARAERRTVASRSGYRLRLVATFSIRPAIAAESAGESEYGFSFVLSVASAGT